MRTGTITLMGGAARVEAKQPHDAMPPSLRAFLKLYGNQMTVKQIVGIVDTLQAGVSIKVTTPDGKVFTLEP